MHLSSPDWRDYELLDSGNGAKLERFGPYTFVRPDSRATWKRALPNDAWISADGVFHAGSDPNSGRWEFRREIDARWTMQYRHLRFWAAATPYRHMGVFPEQAAQWDWFARLIQTAARPVKVLNLFAYTGLATLAAAAAGASVAHIDSSRKAIAWGRDNQQLSGLEDRPIRWIVEDALKFVQREGRRGATYDGLIMDPPPFGRGPKGELWQFDKSLPVLLDECRALLSDQPLFVVLTAYTLKTSLAALQDHLGAMMAQRDGTLSAGEAVLVERSAGRVLPEAFFARWQSSS